MNENQVYCVAGMHRSGTSLMANWLHDSGLFLGDRLLSGFSDNKKGHYEDLDFLELHQKLMLRQGLHDSGLILKEKPLFDEIAKTEAQKLIHNRAEKQLWAWKEPRSTLFLNEWKELIPQLKVIAIYRDIDQVLLSIYKRLKKNKWYPTRNPLKKWYWKMDIDWSPTKWYNIYLHTTNLYLQQLVAFGDRFPEDIVVIDQSAFVAHNDQFTRLLKEKLKLDLNYINIESIFDKHLMNKGQKIDKGLDVVTIAQYKELLKQLMHIQNNNRND